VVPNTTLRNIPFLPLTCQHPEVRFFDLLARARGEGGGFYVRLNGLGLFGQFNERVPL
jgi:hypothetical protein